MSVITLEKRSRKYKAINRVVKKFMTNSGAITDSDLVKLEAEVRVVHGVTNEELV